MNLPRRAWIFIAGVAGLLALLLVGRPPSSTVRIGSAAPDFALSDPTGRVVRSADLRGTVLLINFWATWCYTCVTEMPSLNRLAAHFAGRPFQILGISEDGESGGGWEAIAAYRRRIPIAFTILLDPDGVVADAYGTYSIPESFLLDVDGRLVRKVTGAIAWDDPAMLHAIEQLLAAP